MNSDCGKADMLICMIKTSLSGVIKWPWMLKTAGFFLQSVSRAAEGGNNRGRVYGSSPSFGCSPDVRKELAKHMRRIVCCAVWVFPYLFQSIF